MEKTALPYTELSVGEKIYLLRLTALSAVRLEERLGMSVYGAAEHIDEMKVMSEFIFALVEGYRPEFTKQDTYALIDDYISEGGDLRTLAEKIAEALRISGFFGGASGAREN